MNSRFFYYICQLQFIKKSRYHILNEQDGEVKGVILRIDDITHRKQILHELEATRNEALAAKAGYVDLAKGELDLADLFAELTAVYSSKMKPGVSFINESNGQSHSQRATRNHQGRFGD